MESKRKRGRPAGVKDTKPRTFRAKTLGESEIESDDSGLLSVEQQIKRLKHPVRVSTLSAISGLSEATLRKKIEQGKIRAYKRSGIILIEPKDFLEYWAGGTNRATFNRALFARRPLNVN
jgi:Helix-turn-helix domain